MGVVSEQADSFRQLIPTPRTPCSLSRSSRTARYNLSALSVARSLTPASGTSSRRRAHCSAASPSAMAFARAPSSAKLLFSMRSPNLSADALRALPLPPVETPEDARLKAAPPRDRPGKPRIGLLAAAA